MNVVSCAGYFLLLYLACKFLHFFWILLRGYVLASVGFVKDLKSYGKWVVVTGATAGIGKQYALQLAEKGFNIVLISRTMSKLQAVAKAIEEEYGVKTKVLAHDFSNYREDEYQDIEKELRDLDIGILVNNVGMAHSSIVKFSERPIEQITNTIYTDVFADVRMTHMVLKGMVERGRGLVVHIAAGAVYIDNFVVPVYSASKVFLTKLVTGLKCEYPGVIDHQVVVPFGVATDIVGAGQMDAHLGMFVLTAKDYVKKAIATMGVLDYVHGCMAHELQGFVCQMLPSWIISPLINRKLKQDFIKKAS